MGKFFLFNQNNSGGSFQIDHKAGISEDVIIEANSADEANSIAESVGIYFDGCEDGIDCECCGDRWYKVDESDAKAEPMIYGETLDKVKKDIYRSVAFVHYLNGEVKKVEFSEIEN